MMEKICKFAEPNLKNSCFYFQDGNLENKLKEGIQI